MQALIIFALVIGAIINTGPEQVPTSLCHDPLLGPSMIIYSDCGGVQEEPEKRKKERSENVEGPAEQANEQVDAQPAEPLAEEWEEQPVEKLIEQPAVQETGGSEELLAQQPVEQGSVQRKEKQAGQPAAQPTEALIEQPEEKPDEQVNELPAELSTESVTERTTERKAEQRIEKQKAEKQKCNKGSGNGAEGCDPGNHPEKGNDDEGGERTQDNNKNKTEKSEKQKCNKGSGNGGEGCDPGNHPEKGNDDENGDEPEQKSKKNKTEPTTGQETPENQKCNKGSGNGAEGCDPGNHPEKGNDDEGGEGRPQNAKKDKKH